MEETAGEDGNLHFEQVGYQSVLAIPYDMPIVGYGNHVVDSLMIWDAQPKEEFSLDSFDRGEMCIRDRLHSDITERLCLRYLSILGFRWRTSITTSRHLCLIRRRIRSHKEK